jgi:hypothetical protein
MTVDVGVTGFSALLAKPPPAGEDVTVTMKLDRREPLVAAAVPGEVRAQTGSVRVSFAFKRLPDADRAALETLVIDTALSQLAS